MTDRHGDARWKHAGSRRCDSSHARSTEPGIRGCIDADVAALRAVAQRVIHEHERDHRFGDRRGADADAGIVAAFGDDFGRRLRDSRCGRESDARRRLERDRRDDRLPARNAAEDAAGMVRQESSGVISSRCSLPFCATAAKPSPISTPLTALMLISAAARSPSSLP
jgi:hypothetical protein